MPLVGPTSERQAPSDQLAPQTPSSAARTHRRAETARLFDEAVQCDGAVREGLLDQIIRLNMVIAGELARRYHGRGSSTRSS